MSGADGGEWAAKNLGGATTRTQHGEHHDHEAYVGDRTTEAIVSFAEKLVPAPAGSAALPAADLTEHALQTVKVGSPRPCTLSSPILGHCVAYGSIVHPWGLGPGLVACLKGFWRCAQ